MLRRTVFALFLTATPSHAFAPPTSVRLAGRSLTALRGGNAGMQERPARRSLEPMPIPTRNTPPTPVERFRKDYAPLPYRIDSVSLDIDIRDEQTTVTATLQVLPQADSAGQPLDLDGVDLVLYSIELDGKPLARGTDFELTYDGLRLLEPPQVAFELKTAVAIKPELNTQLSGKGVVAAVVVAAAAAAAAAAAVAVVVVVVGVFGLGMSCTQRHYHYYTTTTAAAAALRAVQVGRHVRVPL